jgi:hypothetical protein
LNLTVKLTEISRYQSKPTQAGAAAGRLLTCDRCHRIDAIVVVVMQIVPLEEGWALCGACAQELPEGFHVA